MTTESEIASQSQDKSLAWLDDAPLGCFLWDAARLINLQEAEFFGGHTFLPPMLTLMWHVRFDPGQPISHYSSQMSVDLASMGRYVNSLAAAGLLEKTKSDDDNRKRMLRLSPKGVALLSERRESYRGFEATVRSKIGARNYDKLVSALKTFMERNQ